MKTDTVVILPLEGKHVLFKALRGTVVLGVYSVRWVSPNGWENHSVRRCDVLDINARTR